jgi:hypothetical protein
MPSWHAIGVAFYTLTTPDKKWCERIAVPITQQVFKSIYRSRADAGLVGFGSTTCNPIVAKRESKQKGERLAGYRKGRLAE